MRSLAIDLGASSGKAIVGEFNGDRLSIEEIHRFSNDPVRIGPHLHWDILRLFFEVQQSIRAAQPTDLTSIGIDSWGLDFGLIGADGKLLGNPYHYRNQHTTDVMEAVWAVVPRAEIFARTGIQFMPINTLYQFYALKQADSPILRYAETLLMIPGLLGFFLTGERINDYSTASTTQFLGLQTGDWDRQLLERLGLPVRLLPTLVQPATSTGQLQPAVCQELGTRALSVITVAGHDTASAVAAVPATGDFAYLICGTWSLLGTELSQPIADVKALEWNFTNERGMAGTVRLLKNIMGLWLSDSCCRVWDREGHRLSYAARATAVDQASPLASFVDPDVSTFLNPPHMPEQVQAYCRATNQRVPETPGEILRCIHESLAMKYRLVLERTEQIAGRHFSGLHIVGGGANNEHLCQFTANAIGRPVWAGPGEATAIGNLLGQYLAAGQLRTLREGRALVKRSFPIRTFEPQAEHAWEAAFVRFLEVIGAQSRSYDVLHGTGPRPE